MEALIELLRPLQFRGKLRLLTPLTPAQGSREAQVFGYRIQLDLSEWADRLIYLGCYEPLNTHRFKQALRPGMTVVDVGANLGYFTLLASRLVGPTGRIFAVEPEPTNADLLAQTLERNHLKHVRLDRIGLGDAESTGRISSHLQEGFNNRTASMVPQGTGVEVRVRTLDSCLDEWGVQQVDLLKIDVDGFETRIIQGAAKALAQGRIRRLIIEFNDYWIRASGSTPEELASRIEKHGLRDTRDETSLRAKLLLGRTEDRFYTLKA